MRKFYFVLTAISALSLFGCEVETPDGRIPSEHADQAQPYLGSYRGQIGNQSGVLTLRLVDGNRAVATFSNDVVGSGCDSQIGQLNSIDVNSSKKVLKGANFALATDCKIAGAQLELDFKNTTTIVASYLREIRREYRCRNLTSADMLADPPRREPPRDPNPPRCGYENVPYYSSGTLSKIN